MDTIEFDIEFLSQRLAENPQSPLFARLADLYLQNEQTVEALKLCEEGIALFPDYYAGYIVQGKIHLALKEYSKARDVLGKARALSPFNHTIDWLIKSIPDQQDESVRTTDENYFSSEEATRQVDAGRGGEPPVISQTIEEPAPFETPTAEEMGFSHQFEGSPTEPASELTIDQEQQQSFSEQTGKQFPTIDEYFAQQQARVSAEPTRSLDDFLSGPAVVVQPEEARPSEFAEPAATFTDPAAPFAEQEIQQPSDEPEMIFSSPEQAQLFAEMAGESPAEEGIENRGTDIDDLAERLQNVERIVPLADTQPGGGSSVDDTEQSQSFGSDMVTPTLAEIYASQGEYTAAIQAYEILMFSQPGKTAEFQQRVRELQQLQMERDGLV